MRCAVQEASRWANCRSTATPRQVHTKSRLLWFEVGHLCRSVDAHAGCSSWLSAKLLQSPSLVCRRSLHGDSCAAVVQVDSGAATAAAQSLRRLSTTTTATAQAQFGVTSLGQQPVLAPEPSSPAVTGACCPQPLLTMASATAVMEQMRAHMCNAHIPVFSADLNPQIPQVTLLCFAFLLLLNTISSLFGHWTHETLLVNISPCSVDVDVL